MRLWRFVAVALVLSGCQGGDAIVRPDEPGKLVLEPSSIEAHAGQSFMVKASLPNGSALSDSVTWTTSDQRVAWLFGDSILGRAQGTATVTATTGDRTGTVKVTVLTDVALGGFQSPFIGDFPTGNVFDHDLPYYFKPAFNNGHLLSYWGEKFPPGADSHNGYDWIMPSGTPIYSAAPGRVVFAGTEKPVNCPFLPNNPVVAGLWVNMAHAVFPNESIITQYGHFTSISVKAGDQIPAGHLLGYSGSTGCSTAPHLHFTVLRMRGTESVQRAGSQSAQRVMDPYGWSGPGQDPWAADTGGVESVAIWGSKAPALFGPGRIGFGDVEVAAFAVQAWGVDDALHPNNEVVDLTTSGAGADLTGWSLRNAAGDRFDFPAGTTIPAGPTGWIRVYSGAGTNALQTLYWGRTSPAWDNLGDCLQIFDAAGNRVSHVPLMNYNKCAELGLSVSALRRRSAPLDYPAPVTSIPDRRED